jgi:hypothetical protein
MKTPGQQSEDYGRQKQKFPFPVRLSEEIAGGLILEADLTAYAHEPLGQTHHRTHTERHPEVLRQLGLPDEADAIGFYQRETVIDQETGVPHAQLRLLGAYWNERSDGTLHAVWFEPRTHVTFGVAHPQAAVWWLERYAPIMGQLVNAIRRAAEMGVDVEAALMRAQEETEEDEDAHAAKDHLG